MPVNKDSNVATELARLERLARERRVSETGIAAMLRAAEPLVAELKHSAADAASTGFSISVTKTIATDEYKILFTLEQSPATSRSKSGLLSRLFGR